ncbi:response regulator [Puia sp. P3]|uniref:response regulator n=1 Tax=Puia sp. P3 TaxID=3423952 RepID=UPI003D66F1E4
MPIRILLIDDDVDDELIFREIIEEISPDIECISAHNGLEALNLLAGMDPIPTMIFLDLNMPIISGWECLDRIRKDQRTTATPVVIMTTSDNQADKQKAVSFRATAFLTKTADLSSLRQILRKTLTAEHLI